MFITCFKLKIGFGFVENKHKTNIMFNYKHVLTKNYFVPLVLFKGIEPAGLKES